VEHWGQIFWVGCLMARGVSVRRLTLKVDALDDELTDQVTTTFSMILILLHLNRTIVLS
jgi:hypothetical protein